MPFYRNKVDRKITIFLNNAIPIKFEPFETIELSSKNLHILHANYLDMVTREEISRGRTTRIEEEVEETIAEPVKKVVTNEKIIAEVKEPTKNKELISEPVKEGKGVKKSKKKKTVLAEKKINDGYNQLKKEVTVAKSGK